MPQEDLTIKFNTQGADRATRDFDQVLDRVKKMRSAFADLAGPTSPSVGFVQAMSKGLDGARQEITKTGASIGTMGTHMTSASTQMRLGTRIITSTVGQMAGAVNPMLGAMVGSLRLGAGAFAALGGPVAAAVVGVQLISVAIEAFIKKMQDAVEWQTKFNLAVNSADLGGLRSQMSEIVAQQEKLAQSGILGQIMAYWTQETDPKKIEDRMARLKTAFRSIYDVFEKPKAAADLEIGRLNVEQQRMEYARETVASAAGLGVHLSKQLETVRAIAEQEKIRATKEAELAAMPMRQLGLTKEADEMVANAKKKADLQAQLKDEAELRRARTESMNFERDRMNESLDLARQYSEIRVSMIDTTLSEEDRAKAAQKIKVDMINQELAAYKELGRTYADNAEVQRQVGQKMISLAQQRMKVEIDAATAVIEARRKQAEEEKRLEEAKASAGKGLRGEAIQALKARGRKGATEAEITSEAERLTAWGKHYATMQERDQPVTFEQMEFAERIGGYAKQARKAGATVGGAMRAERRAAEDGIEFKSWEELTGGKDAAVKKAAETAAKTFGEVLKTELGTPQGGVVRAITDGIIRQLEFEAARQ